MSAVMATLVSMEMCNVRRYLICSMMYFISLYTRIVCLTYEKLI